MSKELQQHVESLKAAEKENSPKLNRAQRRANERITMPGNNRKTNKARHSQKVDIMMPQRTKFGIIKVPTGYTKTIRHNKVVAKVINASIHKRVKTMSKSEAE